ncbi:N(2)-citryl-N(6)-acetyl-N(6)-hydroxylysine synthase [Marinomonas spartinae]|uniref:IucA/IucC family protein n=1 Tax=Marinomonas spartinae TaxID=1792290 RepID=UPI000809065A|nr:IucA/IucC family protein [Marinomonas spartinae]SBS35604.1 N(2)-citryl-N(6)-acetyl-N(6)-hydroxylysine synthase [Marinomonas spartinae]
MKQPQRMMAKIVSELAMTHALLNCLIKEFALPEKKLRHNWPEELKGLQPESCLNGIRLKALPILIELSPKRELFVLVDRYNSLGSQRYLSDVYVKHKGSPWAILEFEALAKFILEGCVVSTGSFNLELFEQVLSSQQLVSDILSHQEDTQQNATFSNYITSEQSLWFGHPSHPAPKARMWPDVIAQQDVTPEFQASAFLHCFEVPIQGLQTQSNSITQSDILNAVAPQGSLQSYTQKQPQSEEDYALISMHPVQAQLFMQDDRVKSLLQQNIIRDKGQTGFYAQPTASIRTWYIDNSDYFIKGSLNVRITNCVRKNAWYELESAMAVDHLLNQLVMSSPNAFKDVIIAREPATLSWSPLDANEEDQRWFREQTGIILRENFCKKQPTEAFLLAATAFARDNHLQPMIWKLLGSDASNEARLAWFSRYQQALLPPILNLFFDHGIVTEPHLQNTVFTHEKGVPKQILLRDFEGVKLTDDLGCHYLDTHFEETIHPTVKASLIYSREKGWKRIAYCLFVNNLSEAILALSWDRPHLADAMWAGVEETLVSVLQSLSLPAPELKALLQTGEIACKCNLKVRLAAQADKQADYVPLTAPWCQEVTYA